MQIGEGGKGMQGRPVMLWHGCRHMEGDLSLESSREELLEWQGAGILPSPPRGGRRYACVGPRY